MALGGALATRMGRELKMLQMQPPPGVWAAPVGDSMTKLEAQIQGPKDTVYEGGVFSLSVDIPARYPFEPPKVKFVTPIYHPNIDPEGRICLDILNMPPKGAWKPSLNVPTVLASVGLLLAEPNPDDGLVSDITAEFRHQRQVFDAKARQWTQRHAMQGAGGIGGGGAAALAVQTGAEQQAGGTSTQAGAGEVQPQGLAAAAEEHDAAVKENSQPQGPAAAEQAPGAGKQHEAASAAQQQQQQQQPAKRPRLALRK